MKGADKQVLLPNKVDNFEVSGNTVDVLKFWTLVDNQKRLDKQCRPWAEASVKEVHLYKEVRIRFADFISFFLNITWKWNNLFSLRPNYFIFIGYY